MEKEIEREIEKYRALLVRMFMQNVDGKKILELWERTYLYGPTFDNNNKYEIYMREGENRFIRRIIGDINAYIATCKKGELINE